MRPDFVALEGQIVRLEPFADRLKDQVGAMLDCDVDAWAIMASSGQGEHFESWWDQALAEQARGERMPYAIRRRSDGQVVGTTSYLNLRPAHRGLEIGHTFLHPDVRGGAVNADAKRLLLGHAFAAGLVRVELMVDRRNARSQAAVRKLGAQCEGVMRRHKITWTGHIRDTAVFSIIAEEWPVVREALERRLADA